MKRTLWLAHALRGSRSRLSDNSLPLLASTDEIDSLALCPSPAAFVWFALTRYFAIAC
jgi:hypothetical protein